MSVYAVNTFCRRVVHDPELRRRLEVDPQATLRAFSPRLDTDEITALAAGDVGTLSRRGANHFLLHQLGRWRLFGLDLPGYAERIRDAHRAERETA